MSMSTNLISAIIAASVSLLVSALVAAWTQRRKLESDYDAQLRSERLAEYRQLWQMMESIGWYGGHEITMESAKQLLRDLDHWYFENGSGLLLSDVSYKSLEELLRALYYYEDEPDQLRRIGSKLRTALAYDIGGRKRPLLRPRIGREELERPEVIDSRMSGK